MMGLFAKAHNEKPHSKKCGVAEIWIWILFIVGYGVITVFHEPWFDEAQAWAIAKDVSFQDILFTVGHYEGHPFLWFFLLAIPAKLGVPFEIGLKSIGLLIAAMSAYLCIFQAPFPKAIRFSIPFTYFFFYQFGIIVRPYGLMLLLFLFSAMAFRNKDTHPWRLVLLLMLQCFLNAFGMVLAGGIAICWVLDILQEYRHAADGMKGVVQDRRFLPLSVLLIAALCTIGMIFPYADTYCPVNNATNSRWVCFIVAFFTFLGDSLITTSPFFSSDLSLLQDANFEVGFVMAGGFISCVLAATIISFSAKKKIKYFFIPYLLFVLFSAVVYFGIHHIGILALYMLFWCWINAEDEERFAVGRYLGEKLKGSDKDKKLFQKVGLGILSVCILVGLYWSVGSSLLDIKYQYSYGREAARFLQTSGLDQLNVAGIWAESSLEDDEKRSLANINTLHTGLPTLILAYYDQNFIYTVHNGDQNKSYAMYKQADVPTNAANLAQWREHGIPDVIIGGADIEFLANGKVTRKDYAPVYKMPMNYIFKAHSTSFGSYIYLRRDLLEQYGLTELESMNFQITEEMKERFYNGESVESILEPYFRRMGLLPDA